MRSGFFDISIPASFDRFNAVLRVLKVGSSDQNCIDIFARIEFVVVTNGVDFAAGDLLDVRNALFAAAAP